MSSHALTGTLQGQRYQLVKTLGQGGFGITYQALDSLLQRQVVIKELFLQGSTRTATGIELPPSLSSDGYQGMLARFVGEARALAKFNSEHIVRIQDVFLGGDTAYIVMDFIAGRTLMQRLRDEGPLPPDVALRMARQLAGALELVHHAGLLHRDIKPDNIYLSRNDTPILIDFGAAREYASDQQLDMSVILTPGFAPIEQYSNNGNFGPYTDLYALAATLLYATTVKLPPLPIDRLQGAKPLPEMPATYTPGLRQAVRLALSVQPADRPQTAEEFVRLLNGGRDDYGATEIARSINSLYLADPPTPVPQLQRVWAQGLLAVWARREGRVPNLGSVSELQEALARGLEVLPLFKAGFDEIYGDLDLAASDLAEVLPGVLNAVRLAPQGLPEFAEAVTALAALSGVADLPAPGTVWRAPQVQQKQRPVLPPLASKFQEFLPFVLDAADVHRVGFADPVQVLWTLAPHGQLRTYHAATGALLGEVHQVTCAAASERGVYTGSPEGNIEHRTFEGVPVNVVAELPFLPVLLAVQGSAFACGGSLGELLIQSGNERHHLQFRNLTGRSAEVLGLEFSVDGQLLMVRDEEGVSLIRVQTRKVLRTLTLAGHATTAAALSADGHRAASAHGDRVVLWDVLTGRETGTFQAPATVDDLFFNPNGRMLGVLAEDLFLYNQAGQPLAVHEAAGGYGVTTRMNRSGRILALAGRRRVELLHLAAIPEQAIPAIGPAESSPPPSPWLPAAAPPVQSPARAAALLGPSTSAPSLPEEAVSLEADQRSAPSAAAFNPLTFLSRDLPAPPSQALNSMSETTLGTLGVQPYQETVLPPQGTVDITRRSAPELLALMHSVVQTEGPIHVREVFRRVVAAHGLAKIGGRIDLALTQVLDAGIQQRLLDRRGAFLWPIDMHTAPVRNRAALPSRTLDLICDEELREAGRAVQHNYPHQGAEERAVSVARLLGFSRLTEPARRRIQSVTSEVAS